MLCFFRLCPSLKRGGDEDEEFDLSILDSILEQGSSKLSHSPSSNGINSSSSSTEDVKYDDIVNETFEDNLLSSEEESDNDSLPAERLKVPTY